MSKTLSWNFLAAFTAVLFGSSVASWAVDADGILNVPSEYATIQEAIDNAGPNQVIFIAPGTYNEALILGNHDGDGDMRFDTAGLDRNLNGLQIIGGGTSPGQVVIQAVSSFPAQDRCRFNVITAYEPRGISDPSYTYANTLLLRNTYAHIANSTQTSGANYSPKAADTVGNPSAGSLEGVKIKNLTLKNGFAAIAALGYITNLEVQNCVLDSGYMGVRATNGLDGANFFNNTFKNFKFAMYLEDGSRNNKVVDNTFLVDSNMPQSWDEEGNTYIAFGVASGQTAEFNKPVNNLFSRNVVDFTGYTGDRASTAMYIHAGEGHRVDGNVVRGTTSAGDMPGPSWYVNTGKADVSNWSMEGIFQGLYIESPLGPVVDRNNFTNFVPDATNPWSTEGSPAYHHAPCDQAFGTQWIEKTVAVPASGTTTLSFTHWFSLSWGEIYLEASTDGGDTWATLRQSQHDWYDTAQIRQYWGTVRGSDDSTRHGYGPDCSGWWDPTARIEPPKAYNNGSPTTGFNKPAPYNGLTTDGVLNESVDLSAYAGSNVTLRFRHVSGDKRCYECEIAGTNDWCGWYIKDIMVDNDGSPLFDETAGANLANWSVTNTNTSYALSVRYTGAAGERGLTVSQNNFSNPHGDGLRFTGNTTQPIKVNNNEFEGNRDNGLFVSSSTSSPTFINAEDNWWGSNNGPTIGTNPDGDGDAIYDPNGVADYNPFVKAVVVEEVVSVTIPSASDNRFSCAPGSQYNIAFKVENGELLAIATCDGGTTAAGLTFTQIGSASTPGALLIQVTAADPNDLPKIAVGDYLTISDGPNTYRAFLPPNTNGLYSNNLLLWLDSDGSTYFACDSANRNCTEGSANFRSFAVSKNAGDVAQDVGSLNFELVTTAGSDFNWIGLPHFRAEVNDSSALFDELNGQGGGNLVRTIAKWNPISQTYTQYSRVPFPLGNFSLAIGEAYRVEVNNASNFALQGAEPVRNSLEYTLRKTQGSSFNWLSLPWYKTDLVFASDLTADVDNAAGSSSVLTVSEWNPVSQQFTQYVPRFGTGNFDVSRGQAYRVEVNKNVTYTPSVAIP